MTENYIFNSGENYKKALVIKPGNQKKRGFWRSVFPSRGDSPFEAVRKTIFIIALATAIVCFGFIAQYLIENYQNHLRNDELKNIYTSALENTESGEYNNKFKGGYGSSDYTGRLIENDPSENIKILPGAEKLLELNKDVAGYFSIPGTGIDYPLMQGKNDNDKYLHTDLYGNHLRAGSIFLDYRCVFDDVKNGKLASKNSDCLVIYGHNMRDGSMFGKLKNYRNDDSYYEKHAIIDLNSNYAQYKYKIFGYFIADPEDEDNTFFDYWNKLNFDDEEDFYDFVNEIKRRSLRNTNVDIKYGDKLLILSTCNNLISNGRFVVAARLVRDGEDPDEGITGSSKNDNAKMPLSYYKSGKSSYDEKKFVPYNSTNSTEKNKTH